MIERNVFIIKPVESGISPTALNFQTIYISKMFNLSKFLWQTKSDVRSAITCEQLLGILFVGTSLELFWPNPYLLEYRKNWYSTLLTLTRILNCNKARFVRYHLLLTAQSCRNLISLYDFIDRIQEATYMHIVTESRSRISSLFRFILIKNIKNSRFAYHQLSHVFYLWLSG